MFRGEKEAGDRQTVKLHSLDIRLKAHAVRNYLDFATRYTGQGKII